MEFTALPSTQDRSVNFVHRTADGGAFEARYVRREDDYFIAYLSSHTGCNRACRFCHLTQTGQTMMGEATILDYVAQARQVLKHYGAQPGPKASRVNFNFMARGEPFLNHGVLRRWSNLRTSLAVAAEAYGLEPRFNLSTIFPKSIARTPLKSILGPHPMGTTIYYSLYSLDEDWRRKWLPKAADPFSALVRLREWQRETGGDVVLHWAFIEGQNDDDVNVDSICAAIRSIGLDARFNLVRYNPFSPVQGKEPSEDVIQRQFAKLEAVCGQPGSRIVPRVGFDVKASCGMFVETATSRIRRSTSKQAEDAIRPVRARLVEGVFDLIQESPRTCWEIEQIASMSHQTASARVNDLIKSGRIVDSGEKRKTGAGRNAIVWRARRPEDNVLIAPTGKAAKALQALQPEPFKVPEGYVLVPKEITEPMASAWQTAFMSQLRARTGSGRVSSFYKRLKHESAEVVAYRSMLGARPKVTA